MIKRFIYSFLMLIFSTSAHSVIIGGAVTDISGIGTNDSYEQGGAFIELSLPFDPPNGSLNTVGDDTFQNPNLYAFNEGQNITLTQDYSVNIGATLSLGTTISSHYVFFDPAGATHQEGWVDFDSDILAVITSTSLLAASDDFLNNHVNYLNPGYRGLESGDSVWIGSNDHNRLYVDWYASTPGDFVRVITGYSQGGTDPCSTNPPGVGGCPASVSEPAPLSLLLMGIVGIGLARKIKANG